MADLDSFKERIVGTNIDSRSFLSTDYFNHFNEVVMMFGMLVDMPELLDEVDKWEFKDYRQHFLDSGLGFAPLAIECYEVAPADLKERLERIVQQMNMLVLEARAKLRETLEAGELDKFKDMAQFHSLQLQGMIDDGAAVVHGRKSTADQDKIDEMFS